MTEAGVQQAFVTALRDRGWDVTTENPDFTDVIARRGTDTILAEVKGHTRSTGTDLDTAYGQLLRRMRPNHGETRYALVVPADCLTSAERVSAVVRNALKIDLWGISLGHDPTTDSPWFPTLHAA